MRSSSIPVDKQSKYTLTTTKWKSQRRVRINESLNEYFGETQHLRSAESHHDTWYTNQDYASFRANLQAAVKTSRERCSDLKNLLYFVYSVVCEVGYVLHDARTVIGTLQEGLLGQLYLEELDLVLGIEYQLVPYNLESSFYPSRADPRRGVRCTVGTFAWCMR